MSTEEMIALECPHCQGELYRPIAWFRGPSFTCPVCGKELKPKEFATIIAALEEAMECFDVELLTGETPPSAGCCGSKGHCGKGH